MFAIVISEKGGAEKREAYDQSEISIGRVQGNDLMLPKGNVSKRHARLVFRDGRFIVTDMNSTNGTYVNRRRISQATIVRQGDRIYIGDFVIRIEPPEESSGLASRQSVPPIPLREPMMTSPDTLSRSKIPQPAPAPPLPYPPVPPAPRLPTTGTTPDSGSGAPPSSSSTPGARKEASVAERLPSSREDSIDTETTLYRSAVSALVERVTAKLEPGFLDAELGQPAKERVEKAIETELAELRREDVIGAAIVDDRLKRDARAELVGLGAVGPLVEDEGVSEIAVAGVSAITATRGGRRTIVEPPLSSEASVRRVLLRLSRLSGNPIGKAETGLVSRRLSTGWKLSAITGPLAPTGTLLKLERGQRVDSTLDDLVRAGAVSRAVATFLKHCVAVRTNILVVGPREARPLAVAGALVSASSDGQVVALSRSDVIVSSSVNVSHLDVSGEDGQSVADIVAFAGKLPDARLVTDDFSGATAAAVLDAVNGGADGLVGVVTASSVRRGLARLPVDLTVARPGLTVDAAREWVASTFDIVMDVARLRDGRQRVVRICEPAAVENGEIVLRDIFTFVVERMATGGSVEGTFQATGIAPKVVADMTSRGIHVDSGVFSRPPSR
ncbi:MAG TPA: FHA domain-containing protein [Polyangiaceae bacterium]|nr:FHA domain-containing protein [Polyangiaceae bacterium]